MINHPHKRSHDHACDDEHTSPLSFGEWQQILAEEEFPQPHPTDTQPPPPPPLRYDDRSTAPSIDMLFVDPTLLPDSDLATYCAPSQPPPLSWVDQTRADNDSYVSMMLQPPPPLQQHEPPHQINTPAPRRSARIAAVPRAEVVDVDVEESQSSSMSVTDGQTSDEDSDDKKQPQDKKEKRRAQVREASSRRRRKLKTEVEFIAARRREQQEHMDILNRMYPPP